MCDHVTTVILLNDIMGLNLSSLGSNYQQQFCCFFETDDFVLLVLWFDITYTDKHRTEHTRTNRSTRPYQDILTPSVMCTQPLRVSRWIDNSLVQKFTLQRPAMSLLFKNYSLIEVIYLLIRFNKIKLFLWNTMNTDRNGVNEQNTTHRKITLERVRVSYPLSVIPPYLGQALSLF